MCARFTAWLHRCTHGLHQSRCAHISGQSIEYLRVQSLLDAWNNSFFPIFLPWNRSWSPMNPLRGFILRQKQPVHTKTSLPATMGLRLVLPASQATASISAPVRGQIHHSGQLGNPQRDKNGLTERHWMFHLTDAYCCFCTEPIANKIIYKCDKWLL